MKYEEIVETEERLMANVYARKHVAIIRGKGALVWDINNKEYIDCTGSYGVCVVGHCHPRVVEAIQKQAETLISCHGSFYNDVRSELLEKLVKIAPKGLEKVIFSNSGTESVECAIKTARRFTGKTEIIAMMGAFHGKTMGALSATWDKKYRDPFKPLVPDFKHIPADNLEKLREAVNQRTAAILIEPIRGEGGIRVLPTDYLRVTREICDDKNIVLIFDEVQTGFGRTGKTFACQHSGVTPDIICLAKSVAGGLPFGVTMGMKDVMSSLKVGEHTNTFGGNPMACAAASAAIDVLIEERLAERAEHLGKHFNERLNHLLTEHKMIREIRGLGLMIGVEFRLDILGILTRSISKGVLLLDAGRNVLRFLPPLVIEKTQLDKVSDVLDGVIGEEEHERLCSSTSS